MCMFFRSLYFFFWPLCCLFFLSIQILITSLWYLLASVLSVLFKYIDSDNLPLVSFGHCVLLSVLFKYTDSDNLPLVSFGQCVCSF
jgi:hypothetical protein